MKTRPTKNKRMAVLLTLCMALSLLPITAFANQYTHTLSHEGGNNRTSNNKRRRWN